MLLHKLVSLDLSYNSDLKLEPHVFIYMIQNFTNLEELSLGWVNISSVLPRSLNISSSLKLLNLQYTGLQGKLPHYIFEFQYLETLFLSLNQFIGNIPSEIMVNLTHLTTLDLSNNKLNGTLPSWLFTSPSGDWELDTLLTSLTNLEYLDLSYNGFSVTTKNGNHYVNPDFWFLKLACCKLKVFPKSLRAMQKLKELDLSSNEIHGHIPLWAGEIGGLPQFQWYELLELYLHSNQIEGPFPSSVCNMSNLEFLDLHNNSFGGVIPQCFEKATSSLQLVDLGTNRFQGAIPNVSENSLQVIDLSHNGFVGQLPAKYFQKFDDMKNLMIKSTIPQYLHMAGEPYSFILTMKGVEQDFPQLFVAYTIINLSNNKFQSEIPFIIGSLISLKVLDLSHNKLTGPIPHALGKLSEIESLDLSWNQLTSEIPQSLADLTFLGFLNLSQNHLTGRIPQGKQFNTFEGNSFAGNPNLCGPQLRKKCNEHPQEPQLESDGAGGDEESGFTWEVVALGYGCGTLLGLVMGYLMLSTRKVKWFNAIADAGEYMIITRRKTRRYAYIGQ
ncbi:Leucine-rich repeat-containing protein [Artemisia annua]|uniref:Leucine-rich repeat-containing protein n=1 Tax=Artemisia annua TaxID=35608 RepID=A0A2U1PCP6_ARTAN|nr:Leucine-rich repeat-containing protein [Artemisia annua]